MAALKYASLVSMKALAAAWLIVREASPLLLSPVLHFYNVADTDHGKMLNTMN